MFGQGKSQPSAFCCLAVFSKSLEWPKQTLDAIRRNTRSGIADIDRQHARSIRASNDPDLAAGAVELDGVRQKVQQNLQQPPTIGIREHLPDLPVVEFQVDVPLLRQRTGELQSLPQDTADIDRIKRQLHPSGFDSRDIEHLIDQT
ncbi:hypothetical protein D9M69_595830 [compost metagenome]